MVAYTTAKGLAQVANSSFIGTWDVPTNANWAAVDAATGQVSSISLSGGNLSLSATQMGCSQLTFNSTLTGNTVVTFPIAIPSSAPITPITGPYIVYNACTGSSLYTVTLATTVSSGLYISLPPGELVDVVTDGSNFRFKNLGRVGTYWDYAGSSVPSWVSGCSVPPYLNCDGTVFSSATYPFLATILGGTTLPDSKGRARSALNQGSNRLLSSNNGVNGDVLLSGGGGSVTLSSVNLPNISFPVTDPGHTHGLSYYYQSPTIMAGAGAARPAGAGSIVTDSATTGITVNSGGSGTAVTLATPTYIGGITLIRAG